MLSLPDDAVLEILENLEWKDALACRQTCHRLESPVRSSVLLQYKIELVACGMLDGEHGPYTLPVHERLDRLKLHLAAWQNLAWTEYSSLTPLIGRRQHRTAQVFPFSHDGDGSLEPKSILMQNLPSPLRGIEEEHITLTRAIAHYIRLDPSQDLWMSVNTQVLPAGLLNTCSLTSISTGQPHPLARNGSVIRLSPQRTVVDICGDYILESPLMGYTLGCVVRNWKTGLVKADKRKPWTTAGQGLQYWSPNGYFLDESFVLLYTYTMDMDRRQQLRGDVSLFIVPINPDDTRLYRFFLPDFLQDTARWSERVIPQSEARGALPQGCFSPSLDDQLISLCATTRNNDQPESHLLIDIPVRTLTAYIHSHPGAAGARVAVPWADWGPRGARITQEAIANPAATARMDRISVSGMRRLVVRSDAPHAVTVADYHPRRVARALARGDPAVVRGGSVDGAQTLLPCIETTIPLPEGPARTLAEGRMLSVWLQENGVLFIDTLERGGSIRNAWAYTI